MLFALYGSIHHLCALPPPHPIHFLRHPSSRNQQMPERKKKKQETLGSIYLPFGYKWQNNHALLSQFSFISHFKEY